MQGDADWVRSGPKLVVEGTAVVSKSRNTYTVSADTCVC